MANDDRDYDQEAFALLDKLSTLPEQIAALAATPREPEPYRALRFVGDCNALLENLASAHGEFGEVKKESTGVLTRAGDTFKYADLAQYIDATKAALAKYKIMVLQPLQYAREISIITTIIAGHGGRIEVDTEVPAAEDIKGFGGNITYMRRYAYASAMSLTGELDADQSREPTPMRRQQTPPSVGSERNGGDPRARGQGAMNYQRGANEGAQQRQGSLPTDGPRQNEQADRGAAQQRQAATPQTKPSEPPPGAVAERQPASSQAADPGPSAHVDTPTSSYTEFTDLAACAAKMRELRNELWDQSPDGIAKWTQFCVDNIKMASKGIEALKPEFRLPKANELVRALYAERERRQAAQ